MGVGGRKGRTAVGSKHRQASKLPSPGAWIRHRAGKERIARVGGPSQLRLLSSPPREAWRGSQGWGQRPAAARPHPTRGPLQLWAARRAG